MGFLIRLLIFPILFVKRILWPMVKGVLKAPFKTLKLFFKSSLLIYGVAFVIIYLAVQSWSGSPGTGDHSPPPPPLSAAETAKMQEQVTELPEIQGTIADGNSPFTKKLWGKMDKPSQDLYSREFSYAMYYTPAGETHFFKGPGDVLFGSIQPEEPYQSKTGTYCRNFAELLSFKGEAQRYHGKACQREENSGWCKLGPESTPTCSLGYSEGTMGSIKRTFRRWF